LATRRIAQIAWRVPIMCSKSIVDVSHSSAMLGHHRTKSNGPRRAEAESGWRFVMLLEIGGA
jgi:hypothetical protein